MVVDHLLAASSSLLNGLRLSSLAGFLMALWAAAWDMVTAYSVGAVVFTCKAPSASQHIGGKCEVVWRLKGLTHAVVCSLDFVVGVKALHIVVKLLFSWFLEPNLYKAPIYEKSVRRKFKETGFCASIRKVWLLNLKDKDGKLIKLARLIWEVSLSEWGKPFRSDCILPLFECH